MYKSSLILGFFIIAVQLLAQQGAVSDIQNQYKASISFVSEEIRIDGELDEDYWKTAIKMSDFWMSSPVDDRRVDKEYDTEVMLAYDDKNIYVAAICYGKGPLLTPTLKRDADDWWDGDLFSVVLDPLNEKSNAALFGLNTAGVQMDLLLLGGTYVRSNEGGAKFSPAWDQTWFGETKVYEDRWTLEMAIPLKSLRYGEKDVWGINFSRNVSKFNHWHSWTPIPVQFMVVDLGHTGSLEWDSRPKKTKSNIAAIPYVLTSTTKDFESGDPSKQNLRIGGDAKIAVTSSLNLDLTINPDFSQVDVDEQVTNLSTVNIRFPERRLFFLENSDIFSDFGIPPMRPFFSRRIGLDDDGNAIPIAYGARLSGYVNKDLRIGVMNLQTRKTDEFSAQNYTSVSAHQQVFGRSIFKGYFHNRQATGLEENANSDFNRIGGAEFLYLSEDSKWRVFSGYGLSWTAGLSGDNYFYNAAVGYDTRRISFYTNISGVGNNYRSDVGFIPRFDHYDAVNEEVIKVGYHHGYTSFNYRIYPEDNSVVNLHELLFFNILDYSKDNFDLIQNTTRGGYAINFTNTSSARVLFTHEEQGLLFPFAFTDDDPLPVGTYKFNFVEASYRSDIRKPLGYGLGYRVGQFYNGDRSEYSLNLRYRAQPWGNFSMNFVYNKVDFPAEFGSIELFLISPKVELNFTRNLFWTTFLQYNTQADNFNINSRLQWRFHPLSDLFLVYSDNYATDIWGPKNRGIILKMNYWLNL